jgi:hypothetical protein
VADHRAVGVGRPGQQAAAGHPGDEQLIRLTRHEIRRLLTGMTRQPAASAAQLHWSRWRRRH